MTDHAERCVNCNRTSDQVPVLTLYYRHAQYGICPQCLPVLIHRPANIAALKGDWVNAETEHDGG